LCRSARQSASLFPPTKNDAGVFALFKAGETTIFNQRAEGLQIGLF